MIQIYLERYPIVQRVFELASARHMPIYLVGGSVRDMLLGTDTHDFDFAVDGDGLALGRYVADTLRGAYVPLDRERKTARVLLSPRRAARLGLSPRELRLDIAALRGPDLTEDLIDRDFTINAMALGRTADGHWHLYDPLRGTDDLATRVLRAASPSSLAHDPIRTLRAVRMHTQFGCAIEPGTEGQLRAAVPLLGRVSPERVRDEWFKLLALPGAADALREMRQLGLLRAIVPQVDALDGLEQPAPHRFDVLTHSFETVAAVERLWDAFQEHGTGTRGPIPDSLHALAPQIRRRYASPICDDRSRLALLKCAAFLHDVGKADTGTVTEDGRTRFIGHEGAGAEIVTRWGRQWRCSNVETELLRTVTAAHLRPTWLAARGLPTRRAVYRFFRDTGEYGVDTVLVALADRMATWGEDPPAGEWRRQVDVVARLLTAYYEHRETAIDPPPLVSGRDLMEAFGLAPGKQIGDLLAQVCEAQAAGEIRTRDEALAHARRWIKRQDRGKRTGSC
jgi:putative nucleotidyltransferase with HDIG domain